MIFHIFFTYPETVGKSLEEIDDLFDSNIPAWHSKNARGRFEDRVAETKTGEVEHKEYEA